MYSNKLAVAVKCDGKVLREHGETVYLPFGKHYSLTIKNLNNVRAAVRVWIDGADATDGVKLLVNPNSSFELERFIKQGNLQAGNKFKFIERTGKVEKHRGVKVDDGVVRVEFQFEQPPVTTVTTTWPPYYAGAAPSWVGGTAGSLGQYSNSVAGHDLLARSVTTQTATAQNHVGVTAPGELSSQLFHAVAEPTLESKTHVMAFRLLGEVAQSIPRQTFTVDVNNVTDSEARELINALKAKFTEQTNSRVTQPLTVKARTSCMMCGTSSKSTAKFCQECGASLQYIK